MVIVALIARLVLAVVFAVAGVAKLADRTGTQKAIVGFGAPARLAPVLAIVLPLAELAVAGLLLPAATAGYGAIGALILLAIFSAAIALSLLRGKAPDCHCFGQLHSAPASWKTLARNGALLALAAIALTWTVVDEPTSAVAWLGDLAAAELLALVVVAIAAAVLAVGAFAFVSLMRSYGAVLTRLDRVEAALADRGIDLGEPDAPMVGLDPGSDAPWFLSTRLDGTGASRDDLLADGRPTLLLLTSPQCGPCAALLPEVEGWMADHADTLSIVLASDGTREEILADLGEIAPASVVHDERHELYEAFQANGTPSAVLVTTDGRIASWVASGRDEIAALVERVTAPEPEPTLPIGAQVPELELATLDGGVATLTSVIDRPTVALFWNPQCGYCQSMRDDLLAWEQDTPAGAPALVVISSGSADDTRADAFASPVLLDERFEAGEAFGANGTPMAVLVDGDGRIVSPVVAGADAVLDLADAGAPA